MIHPWLEETWRGLVAAADRLPHALLFSGPDGLGKRDLADALAARLLCSAPGEDGHACGRCSACRLRMAGNHPDLVLLVPATDAAQPGGDGDADGDGAEPGGKVKSSQIVIEQVRDLQHALGVTAHQGSRRVVLVDPADAMNVFTANALLKILEEPPEGCTFLLVTAVPRQLPATLRSRCQQRTFVRPQAAQVASWLEARDADAGALLAVSGGAPLAAARLADAGGGALLARFVRDVAGLPQADPLVLAGQWDSWLKSKDALAARFGMVRLADWMQRWVADLAITRLGGRVRYFPAQESVLCALAARSTVAAVTNCYNEFSKIRRVAQHPLNARLMIEDMLLRYVRALTGPRP